LGVQGGVVYLCIEISLSDNVSLKSIFQLGPELRKKIFFRVLSFSFYYIR